jgi:hypothetical protein
LAGSRTAVRKNDRKKLLTALLCGIVYAAVLMAANALLYKGEYEGVGVSLMLILGGSLAALLLTDTGGRKKLRPNRKKKHR